MSANAIVAKAAGAKVLAGTRSARKPLRRTNRTLVVMALVLLGLVAFVVSQGTNAEHSSVATTDFQAETAVSEPVAPQMS
jgi:hypothetical protein